MKVRNALARSLMSKMPCISVLWRWQHQFFPKIPLAPAPANLLPLTSLDSFEYPNEVILPSIGSFESSGEVEAPNALVEPDAL